MDISEWLPELNTHMYWEKKEQFLLEKDTYLTWVLFAVVEGKFEYRVENDVGEAEFGDVVVCPPYVAFHRRTLTPLSFHAITFDFPYGEPHTLKKIMPHGKIHLPQTSRLSENYQYLRVDHQVPRFNLRSQNRRQHYFLDLWLMIISPYRQLSEVDTTKENDDLIENVALFFRNHAHQTIEIKKVAHDFGLTPVQLIRRFKAVYDINPLQYLTSARIKKACSLLLQTDWTLDVIAGKCGYENGFYLSRVFSKHMGLSPSSFRQQNRF